MYKEPVVEEIRANAARIAEECDGDIHKMAERFRRREQEQGAQVVSRAGNGAAARQQASNTPPPAED